MKAFTLSVLNILKEASITSSENDYHKSCAQFKYQNKRNRQSGQAVKPCGRNMNYQQVPRVPTFNRFARLPAMDQGNW